MNANYSPMECYAVKLMGDDLAHLTELVTESRPLEPDCLPCERIRKAIACAEFDHLAQERVR